MSEAVALAWELAQLVRGRLSKTEQTAVYTMIGAGDTADAIASLLMVLAQREGALAESTPHRLNRWLNGYAGCDFEQHMQHIIDGIPVRVYDQLQMHSSTVMLGVADRYRDGRRP